MEGKTGFNTGCNIGNSHIEQLARWLSCNGEVWGVGPTTVFASAAALFLFNELQATLFVVGDLNVSMLEKTLVTSMVLGMLALMIHVWVCSMRFFQYYLDTLIRDSPSMLLEMTTAGLLGSSSDLMALGPLTRFLRTQQPQIHITLCWFLSLCYADYVRKIYCQRFNMPYLEQWQAELQARATRITRSAIRRARSFVCCVHRRLTGFEPAPAAAPNPNTVIARCRRERCRMWKSVESHQSSLLVGAGEALPRAIRERRCVSDYSHSQPRRLQILLRNSEIISRQQDVLVAIRRTPASIVLPPPPRPRPIQEEFPWMNMSKLPQEQYCWSH